MDPFLPLSETTMGLCRAMLNFQGVYQVANHAGERSMSFLANRSAQRSFLLCDFGGLDRLWSFNAVENNMVEHKNILFR